MSPNRLAAEKSPYLLQHKDNPVDWRPWGPEAFEEAKKSQRPLLLSIGYSTCHWCHVMERESFEDEATAEVMNRLFVCVKLDREERPDVDKVYMTAVQAMGRQGGWPLNVFLTPELKPFFGGTYFPPEPRWGQPGWTQLLERVGELWKEKRGEIEQDASKLAEAVSRFVAAEAEPRAAKAKTLEAALDELKRAYDPENGGFGTQPKFPMPSYQRLLLRLYARLKDADARSMALETLRKMARGGVFDQVGGGFHRYSVDGEWRVPHFEKMLYDNAQLLENLAEAVLVSRDAELGAAMTRTIDYLERDLRGPGGGFHSAEDADSRTAGNPAVSSEGAFYLWSRAELDALLGSEASAFAARYGIEPGGNAPADPHGEFEGLNIPYDKDPGAFPEPFAAPARAKLLAARAKRPRPSLDDKILSSWNGLALTGLARAHQASGDERPLRLAREAAAFVRAELCDASGRALARRWRAGDKALPGLAEDYAFMVQGLLDLYEAGFDPAHLGWAAELAAETIARFGLKEGGLAQYGEGQAPELFARPVEDHDGVEPAPSSVLADACLRLHELTGRGEFREFADRTLKRFGARMTERPAGLPYMLCALDRALGESKLAVIAGLGLPGAAELVKIARNGLRPRLSVAAFDEKTKAALGRLVPAVETLPAAARATAYVCSGGACGLPIQDPLEFARSLEGK